MQKHINRHGQDPARERVAPVAVIAFLDGAVLIEAKADPAEAEQRSLELGAAMVRVPGVDHFMERKVPPEQCLWHVRVSPSTEAALSPLATRLTAQGWRVERKK